MTSEPQCVLALKAELGEGPVWSARENALWFVDIKGRRIHRLHAETREWRSWTAPAAPGFIAPVAGGGWMVGLKTGLHRFDPETGEFTLFRTVEDPALDNRLNDGFVDGEGRLWFGSMHDPETDGSGALYCWGANGLDRCDEGYCITNGPAMSPDGRTLYHTDTLERTIYAFDVSAEGALSRRRIFAVIQPEAGYPDGPSVDAKGNVWTGLFGGWGARRYSPEGQMTEFVEFPCANVTKIAFGGPDLKTAYVTTAWKGLTPDERKAQRQAGGLYSFQVDTPGLPQHEMRHA
jgi:sugar lactone lactonase YvrE